MGGDQSTPNDDDQTGDGDNGGDFGGGDNIIGDGFGPGDDGPAPCGFGGVCPSGQECIEGGCVLICNEARCGSQQLCCANEGTRTECAFDRCQEPCPNVTDTRCGTEGQLCCDTGANQICGASLTCVQNCAGQGPLCGTGTDASFGSVCCNGRSASTTEDDDVCVFNACIPRGQGCQSFLDCEVGEYCELALDPDPTTGYCLPNEFPPDAPICQSPPDDTFNPQTEWAWVGIQLVGSTLADEDFTDDFAPGEVIQKCADATSIRCYREPCTDVPLATGTLQSSSFRNQCFRNVAIVPVTADLDKVDSDPSVAGERLVPEVVFKAYSSDGTVFNIHNVLVIADGRSDAELPSTAPGQYEAAKQQHSKIVIYDAARGHMAIGNLDGDPELEIATAHQNGMCLYDPYFRGQNGDLQVAANALRWCNATNELNVQHNGSAAHLADFDGDGIPEIIVGGTIVRNDGNAGTILLDVGFVGDSVAFSNVGDRCDSNSECFALTAVADVNDDGLPELLAGDKAWTIRRSLTPLAPIGVEQKVGIDGWVADRIWSASYAGGSSPQPWTIGIGRGYPGVANFVDNRLPPYNEPTDTPEVVYVYDGGVYIVSGRTGVVLQSPVANVNLAFKYLATRGGPPNIADFDGDGKPEVSFAGTGCMVVFDPYCATADASGRAAIAGANNSFCTVAVPGPGDLAQRTCTIESQAALTQQIGVLWQYQTQDQSSAVTGTSVFDFQGDGKAEVLYNDECFFRVFEGSTARIIYERPSSNRTITEYPIVVDVDGDSNSEIVITSNGDQAGKYAQADRDRCGGPVLNESYCNGKNQLDCQSGGGCIWNKTSGSCSGCSTAATQGACDPLVAGPQTNCSAGTAATCSNSGTCGWNGSACQTCSALNTAALCDPVANAPFGTACSARTPTTCLDAGGGCGLEAGSCVACSAITTQGACTSTTTSSGCAWNTGNNTCSARTDCGSIRDGSDALTTIDAECNATRGCVAASTTTCVRRVNGCAWTGGTCVPDCARVFDGTDAGGDTAAECGTAAGCGYANTRCAKLANGCGWTGSACVGQCELVTDGPDSNTDFNAECSNFDGCDSLLGTCRQYSYRRNEWGQYRGTSACDCSEYISVDPCNAARGCQWSGSSCQVVTNTACNAFGSITACHQHLDDCIWDGYQGTCEEHPRGQALVCQHATWGVTVYGDTKDEWVKTLPYWFEHPYHITNQDRFGTVIPDWNVCYTGSTCAAVTDPVACEETFVSGSSGPVCDYGDPNVEFYNNFRQNVPGFVPLNAPDLRVETVVADLRTCPPSVKILARVVNKGRAGIRKEGVKIGYYRLTLPDTQTYQVTIATTTPFALPELPVDLLPGGAVDMPPQTYTIPSTEAPIDLDFRVIANPDYISNQAGSTFECDAANNFKDVLNIDCTGTGG